MSTSEPVRVDLAVLGGGLAGGLVALALAQRRPEVSVALVEQGTVGGEHVWSHFAADLDPDAADLVEPLLVHRWPDYDVAFPRVRRTIAQEYRSITSERLAQVLAERLAPGTLVRGEVVEAVPGRVRLADGRVLLAGAVLDARGPGDVTHLRLGYQKFVGRALRTAGPHGVTRPMVMDGSVEQHDGFRFVYLLPLSATEVFVEDTYYSDGPELDSERLTARIDAYARERGWAVEGVGRTESGVLPVVIDGDVEAYWRSTGDDLAKAGMRAGLFHPTTGYSFPDAVRLALAVAAAPDLSHPALLRLTRELALGTWRRRGFYRLLDTMLFGAAEPARRYRVFERFYRLDAGLVHRFYAARSTPADRLRILSGRPPVPVGRAVRAVLGRRRPVPTG